MAREFFINEFHREINFTENVWNIITKKEIGNQMPCLKEEMLMMKSVASTIMEELYNSMQQILIL